MHMTARCEHSFAMPHTSPEYTEVSVMYTVDINIPARESVRAVRADLVPLPFEGSHRDACDTAVQHSRSHKTY